MYVAVLVTSSWLIIAKRSLTFPSTRTYNNYEKRHTTWETPCVY